MCTFRYSSTGCRFPYSGSCLFTFRACRWQMESHFIEIFFSGCNEPGTSKQQEQIFEKKSLHFVSKEYFHFKNVITSTMWLNIWELVEISFRDGKWYIIGYAILSWLSLCYQTRTQKKACLKFGIFTKSHSCMFIFIKSENIKVQFSNQI